MKNGLIVVLCFLSCNASNIIHLSDVTRDTTITIKSNSSYPSLVNLKLKGELNDSFMINKIVLPQGKIDTILRIDWYQENFQIFYKPFKVTSGNLTIEYTF